jgi:glutamate synthase domain-containing protein 2
MRAMMMVWTEYVVQGLIYAFVLAVGLVALTLVVLLIIDRTQTRDAIRRNYPVIGRFRHLFSTLGEFFRQYFFAMDREELPFNRAQRHWIERAAEDKGNTVAFGSTRDLRIPGTPIFVNSAFPPLDDQATAAPAMMIGPDTRHPYLAQSVFNLSGMSYGAISAPAVLALSKGAKAAGIWMNTGEGAVSEWHLKGGADIVFQIGTAKYGVRNNEGLLDDAKLAKIAEHAQIKMFEIKLSQGAKPGKGGILPGEKVTPEIAKVRGLEVGQTSYSPNRHVEVDDWGDLLDFIAHVREVTGKPTGIKLCIGALEPIAEFFALIRKRGEASAPDFITLDGGEGGTGAAPMPLIDLVGMSIRESLPLVADLRAEYQLHDRIRLVAAGKLVNPGDVAWALAAGADFVTSARGFMFSLGCIQALKCNKNTCPTGITTHNPRLQQGLVVEEKFVRVKQYAEGIVHEVETLAHSVGVAEPRQLRRDYVRIVQPDGTSVPMSMLYPGKRKPKIA